MVEKILKPGTRVELLRRGIKLDSPESMEEKLVSSVNEVIDDTTIVIDNPTMKARLIPMHPNERYNAYFFVGKKIYTASVTITKNMTEGNRRVVKVELTSKIEKYERRQYFRLETTMDVRYLLITAANSMAFKEAVKSGTLLTMDGFKKGTTIDISGGGLRFTSGEQMTEGGMAIIHMVAHMEAGEKNYIFLGKVLISNKHAEVKGLFDHRIQFVDLKQDAREELVQFIFQVEREKLKNRSSL